MSEKQSKKKRIIDFFMNTQKLNSPTKKMSPEKQDKVIQGTLKRLLILILILGILYVFVIVPIMFFVAITVSG